MLLVTITVASILIIGGLSYCAHFYAKKAQDAQIKYESIRQFADDSALQILKLQKDNVDLSNLVRGLTDKLEFVAAKKAVKTEAPTTPNSEVVEAVKPAFKKRGRKRRPNTNSTNVKTN